MFNFIWNLFRRTPSYGTGLLSGPADSRNIPLSIVQPPVQIPDTYFTDISMLGVENQGSAPICVGESIAKIAEYYIYKQSGKIVQIDAQQLYNKCKGEDGIPNQVGTYASIAAMIAIRDGVDQELLDSNDKFANGYAFVSADFDAVCQAIYQNGMVTIGLWVDTNWFYGIIGKALSYIGGHQTDLHGYDKTLRKVYGVNSWGVNWIGNIAGLIDPKVKPGYYVAQFDDIQMAVINIIAFVPIPKEIIDEVKNTGYHFVTTMRYGMTSYEVKKLQEKINVVSPTGYFGPVTLAKVKYYQSTHGLVADGIVGPLMRAKLNEGTKGYIPQWIEAIKIMEGAKPSRNNPGNLRFVSQKYAVNDGGFCKFDTYEHGYEALQTLLINACTGVSKVYHPEMNLYQFYAVYAPSSDGNNPDNYANFVANKLGVPATTRIADLL